MIMPCMKSTSAGERGGSVPFVEAGSVLVGLPGAPGWTMTGAEGLDCWEVEGEGNKDMAEVVASSAAPSWKGRRGEGKRRLPRERRVFRHGGQLFEQLEFMMTYSSNMEKIDG
jgi:hypothetical protein